MNQAFVRTACGVKTQDSRGTWTGSTASSRDSPRGQQSHAAPSLQEVLGAAFKIRVASLEGIDVILTFLNRFEGHTFFEWQVLGRGWWWQGCHGDGRSQCQP